MLKSLFIRNYALIDELTMTFGPGLTILSGETGAGKSIILGALDLVTGKRADTSVLLDKERKCVVEAVFQIGKYELQPLFEEEDLDYDEETVVRREITASGKSRAFINDTPVNLSVLQRLGRALVDIHSQHQGVLLASPAFQMKVLDAFTGADELLREYRSTYEDYRRKEKALTELREKAARAAADLDYYRFQYDELEAAAFQEGEQEELERELEVLDHAGEIKNALLAAWHDLSGREDGAVTDRLRGIISALERITSYMPRVGDYLQRLESAYIDLKDMASELEVLGNDTEYDPARADRLRDRLNTLYHLLEKHHVPDLGALLKVKDELEQKIGAIASYDEQLTRLGNEVEMLREQVWEQGGELSRRRAGVKEEIAARVTELLRELGIPAARFEIRMERREEPGPEGFDKVAFLFSSSTQSPPREIAKVASGGELSRIMLSLKSLLTRAGDLPTIIFDEIDSGVSGDIADRMGDIIARMSRHMQVINITHLPQIASKGEDHYLVFKTQEGNKTHTRVKKLSPEERVTEIARMLSGRELSEAALLNARELLEAAKGQ